MKTISISEATDAQLHAFAKEKGLSAPQNIGRDKLVAKIKAVIEGDTIDVHDEPEAAAPKAKAEPAKAKKEFTIVRIATSDQPGGDADVPLGFNGKFTNAPRGVWIALREGYFSALSDAKEEHYKKVKGPDGLTKIDPTPRMVQRFPFEVWNGQGEPEGGVLYPPETTQDVRPTSKPRAA